MRRMLSSLGVRRLACLLVVLTVATAACAGGEAAARCDDPPAADVTTVPGWVGYLAAHPRDVAFVIDDGRSRLIEHRAGTVQPMASASKVLNVVACAREVALGRVDPSEPVTVGEWERWSVLGNEESHALALDHLGIPRDGVRAADPSRAVTIDQIAHQVSIWSDDAGPDYLRARLGDQALLDAARDVGWRDVDLPSTTGFLVSLFTPELVPPATDRPARRAAEWDLARRYDSDPPLRADVDTRPGPSREVERARVAGGPGGTARQLANLWTAIGRGTFPGADRARAITERGPSPYPASSPAAPRAGCSAGSSPAASTCAATTAPSPSLCCSCAT